MDQIRCVDCKKWFSYPVEWLRKNDADRAYLEDGFICESCHDARDAETYYNNGMSELRGWGDNN